MSQRTAETHDEWLARNRAEQRQRYAEDPEYRESRKAQNRAKSVAERERRAVTQRVYRERKSSTPGFVESDRLRRRARIYGLTVAELLALGDECALCGYRPSTTDKALHVDHDHACCSGNRSCGRCVRGVLCYPCNSSFERFTDSPRVIAYLARKGRS